MSHCWGQNRNGRHRLRNSGWLVRGKLPGLPVRLIGKRSVPGSCGAGGYYIDKSGHPQAFVADEVHGTWRKAQQVPGSAALNAGGKASVTSLSCPAAGTCVAAGAYKPKLGPGQLFVVSEGAGKWKQAIQLPGSGKRITHSGSAVGQVSCGSAATCVVGGTLQVAAPGPDGRSGTRGFLAGEINGRWGLYVVPDGLGSTITALSCPAAGYCAAGGRRINRPSAVSFPASMMAIDEVAGRWGKTVSLRDGYIGTPNTESVYAVSCAAPRNCGAGGNLGGYHGLPGADVASEIPVK